MKRSSLVLTSYCGASVELLSWLDNNGGPDGAGPVKSNVETIELAIAKTLVKKKMN